VIFEEKKKTVLLLLLSSQPKWRHIIP